MNLNDRVEVVLTGEGCKIYEECRNNKISNTKDRILNIQLWEFMQIFGPYIYKGTKTLFVKNKLKIPNYEPVTNTDELCLLQQKKIDKLDKLTKEFNNRRNMICDGFDKLKDALK